MRRRLLPMSALVASLVGGSLLPFLIMTCSADTPTGELPDPRSTRTGRFAASKPVSVDVSPKVPAYLPNLDEVANPRLVSHLGQAQRDHLEASGFVVIPRGHRQVYEIYKHADETGTPVFVTTDAVLHTYHVLYDYSLRVAELDHLLSDLKTLTKAMLNAARSDYETCTDQVREAAELCLGFFAVATRLLGSRGQVPDSVADAVERELALIEAHQGITSSPLFGYREDYSQYVPRGHYTRNEDFRKYFKAMMWFGRMSFRLTTPRDPGAADRETRAALLMAGWLHSTRIGGSAALEVWERIYEPTAFFVGTSDDLTVYDYASVAQEVYGCLPTPVHLAHGGKLKAFGDEARKLAPPAILGGLVTDAESAPEEVTKGFRFMGQRFIPDSYVFQQLVYDKVGIYQGTGNPFTMSPSPVGPIRGFPRGLDVPAALGSKRALEILASEGDTNYLGYEEQLGKLRSEFSELPAWQWTENLYWNWLYSLRPLLEVKGEGYPFFMQSPAWIDKDLHTWLGSWTELRHDTILYAKQSYTMLATSLPSPEREKPRGYVEPQPEVYARLVALTAQMRAGLEGRGLLNDEMSSKLEGMHHLLLSLKRISEKELQGQNLDQWEYALIEGIGDALENLTTYRGESGGGERQDITSQADERMAVIADVHTDPNTNQVLEEGIGDAFPVYVVVPVEGRQVVTLGGVFSYYEFKWPMDDRLTDEAWQELRPKPDQPSWTSRFIVE